MSDDMDAYECGEGQKPLNYAERQAEIMAEERQDAEHEEFMESLSDRDKEIWHCATNLKATAIQARVNPANVNFANEARTSAEDNANRILAALEGCY